MVARKEGARGDGCVWGSRVNRKIDAEVEVEVVSGEFLQLALHVAAETG